MTLKTTFILLFLYSMFCNPDAKSSSQDQDCSTVSRSDVPTITFSNENSPRIVGGMDVSPNELPYQLLVVTRVGEDGEGTLCGGVPISQEFILTTAHCTDHAKPADIIVFGGVHKIRAANEVTRQTTYGVRNIIHPDYLADPHKGEVGNDIAIVKVFPPLGFNSHVQPIKLATQTTSLGETGLISGWGCTIQDMKKCKHDANGAYVPIVLQKLIVPIWNDSHCKAKLRGLKILDSHICVGGGEKEGACLGDSGGPLVVEENGQKVLVGITSFGLDVGCGCKDIPTVYTEVSHYNRWIASVLATSTSVPGHSGNGHNTSAAAWWRISITSLFVSVLLDGITHAVIYGHNGWRQDWWS